MDWPRSYAFVSRAEGGFVNNPNDPGGATAKGVSLRAVIRLDRNADGVLDFDLDGDGDVDADDIRLLMDEKYRGKVEDFYRGEYWDVLKCGSLPWPWCMFTFDAGVNHGVGAAALMVQRAVEAGQDGKIGPDTVRRVLNAAPYQQRRFLGIRANLYGRLTARLLAKLARERGQTVDETVREYELKGTFFDGWMARLFDLQHEAWRRA